MKQTIKLFRPEKETSKIVIVSCVDCNRKLAILCNETAFIVSGRCPDCYVKFKSIK